MSERMIELRRQQMGLPPAATSLPPTPIPGNPQSARPGSQTQQPSAVTNITPQQAAAAAVLSEDAQLQRFIHRLQRRDDTNPVSNSSNGPTVPTALARRMLHRQGVGYLDDTVAAAISASADRFLATVLQQAVVCRDQRLNGAGLAREAARHRKRHMQHYEEDTDNRKRRKEELELAREQRHLKAIAAGEALRKSGKDGEEKKSKKKKKKVEEPVATGANGDALNLDDDDQSYDSIDEEEEYYQKQLGEVKGKIKGDDYDDDDKLLLRDLVRPLEAWDFHMTGKEALEPRSTDSDDEEGDEELLDKTMNSDVQDEDNGDSDDDEGKGDKGGDDFEMDSRRKSSASPAPGGS